MPDGKLEHPVEEQASTSGLATVETEYELVQIALEVRLVESALVSAEQPSLRQRRHPMHSGK